MSTIRITGMTCHACERRVTQALSALPGVESVGVSASRGRATISGTMPSDDDLEAALTSAGYALGAPPLFTRDRRAWAIAAVTTVVLALLGWLAVRAGVTAPTPDERPAGPAGGLVLGVLVGLAAGVSTCMALVGGLVLGISANHAPSGPRQLRPHLVFTGGRLAGFAAGGALLGVVGSAARMPDSLVAGASVLAAAVMGVLGLRLTGLSPRLSGWAVTLPSRWGDRMGPHRDRGLLATGAATFLLPCGFTQAMQLYAISLGHPVESAGVMTAFAVGTMPGLLGLGALGTLSGWRDRTGGLVRAVGVLVLAFAVVTGTGGLRALGIDLPRLPGSAAPTLASTTVSPNVQLLGDVQVVSMTQHAHGYSPANTTVWAGIPIRWSIDVTGQFSCSAFLRIPAVGVSADLVTPGRHVVDVPALDVGTTPFACVMGMYGGSFRAIARTTA